jgi:hypothetical protein
LPIARCRGRSSDTGAFADAERLRFDWERPYTTHEWLDQVPTFGGHSTFAPERLGELLSGIRVAIDNVGDTFTMRYAALAITARRRRDQRRPTIRYARGSDLGEPMREDKST